MSVFAQADEYRVFSGRLAAALLLAGVGLLAVAVAVRRRARTARRRRLLAGPGERG